MIVVMNVGATQEQIEHVVAALKENGLGVHVSDGVERTIIGIIGNKQAMTELPIETMDGVEKTVPISSPYKLAGRDFHPDNTMIELKGVTIGGTELVVMAGPCSVESREQIFESAAAVKAAGAHILRGGAFKPRSSPYAFQGLKEEGLKMMREAADAHGLLVVTEVLDPYNLELVAQYTDILQLGARNMQNFHLLREVGKTDKPVLLKRGLSATIEEWLMSAEYVMSEGNYEVILCERGIRTFETYTRNTLDLNAVPVVKHLSHLPVVVDPAHGTGKWRYVAPMALAGVAAGADGVIVEVHPNPEKALSDGPQSLTPSNFAAMMEDMRKIAPAVGRSL